ncbi:MAG: DNA repair protein RadA, partial [Chloroflexi bacterium]|nr:DNA repair protein RadA [Chloroflexota bacterium]
MARPTSRFVCQGCGEAFLRWEGQCRACGAWNSLVETVIRETPRANRGLRVAPDGVGSAAPVALTDIGESDVPRLVTGIGELDRVLGGGFVPGSLVLVGGEPGIGKSTLLLQAAAGLGRPVLYATGEESAAQVRIRAGRLGLLDVPAGDAIEVLAEHDTGRIVEVG